MNVDLLINETKKLSINQIKKKAKNIVIDILKDFTQIYKTTDLFEKHKIMPWELLLRLSYAAIASDNVLNVNEYNLFLELTDGLIEPISPKELTEEIKTSNLEMTVEIIDDFVDSIGKKIPNLKENIVEYAICFVLIDGHLADNELFFVKRLAQD